jgi:hypothetical protein
LILETSDLQNVRLSGFVLALAFVIAAPAWARIGRMRVRVRDTSEGPVPGAHVSLMHEGRSSSNLTDPNGWASLDGLETGTVHVRVEAVGFAVAESDVPIGPGEDVLVEVALSTKPGQSRLLLTTRGTGSRTFFGDDRLRDLPSNGSLWSLIETAETETISDRIEGGGLGLGTPAHVSARGSSLTQTSYRLGDAEVSDPRGSGAPLLDLAIGGLSGLDVQTALLPIDQGAPGALITLVPKQFGETWHGGATAVGTGAGLQAPAGLDGPPIAHFGSLEDASAFVSGPLSAQRLGLSIAGGVAGSHTFERSDPTELSSRRRYLMTTLDARLNDRDTLSLLAAAESTAARDHSSFLQVHARWYRHSSEEMSWRVLGAYDRGGFETAATGVSVSPAERLDGPIPDLVHFASETSRRATLAAQLEPVFSRGRQRVLAGFAASQSQMDGHPPTTGTLVIPEVTAGMPARVWEYHYPGLESTRSLLELAAYVADQVAITDRMTLDLGARVDEVHGSARGAPSSIRWTTVSPRVSAHWSALDKGHLGLLVGYARYQQRLPQDALAYGDPAAPQATVSLWHDANGDRVFQPEERGPMVARVGPGGDVASIDPQLRPPRTDEILVALESRVGGDCFVRLAGVRRREQDLLAPVNAGVPLSGYVPRQIPDPLADVEGGTVTVYDRDPSTFGLDRYVLTNPTAHDTLHEGLELTLEKTLAGRLDFLLAGTAYRTTGDGGNAGFHVDENDQGVLGETFADPNVGATPNARLFFDRSYTLKIASRYRAPGDVRLGVVARYQDGQPFARWLLVPDLHQGPLLVQAFARGRSRFTFTLTVDARAEKGFRWGRARTAAFVEGFNVLNTANEVEEDVLTSPTYRMVTARQPPRVVRLGLRVEF